MWDLLHGLTLFESFVNSERCKTVLAYVIFVPCLRALLIQKDAKPFLPEKGVRVRLRALLIQKDAKH